MQEANSIRYVTAKRLRREMTDAERTLWQALRAHRLNGLKFYRQVPVGPYIVDFVSHRHGLVIEVDGATHGERVEVERDERRALYLNCAGYKVVRFSNSEVFSNLSGVLDSILLVIGAKRPLPPFGHPLYRRG